LNDHGSIIIVHMIIVFSSLAIYFNSISGVHQHFVYMAKSFLQGKLYLVEMPGNWFDAVKYDNHYYWPLGPAPAIVLMPFVAVFEKMGLFFYQNYLQMLLTAAIFYFCFVLAQKFNYSATDSLYLGFAFVFASVYHLSAFIPWSWYFAQTLTVFLTFASIHEYFGRRRYWLIGALLALVFATRFTAGFGIIFFVGAIILEAESNISQKIKNLMALIVPIIIVGVLLLTYNYLRFGDPFNNGYYNVNNHILTDQEQFERKNYGLFQLRNIPTNFYYYFLKSVDPVRLDVFSYGEQTYVLKPPYLNVSYPGVSFFVVAPIFLYIFRARFGEKIVKLALLSVSVTLLALLSYFWPGWTQVGPRYALDFLPYLYLVLLFSFPHFALTKLSKGVIVGSAFFNYFLLMTTILKM